jgi:aspartate/methionine/tyrosine aminotransferase
MKRFLANKYHNFERKHTLNFVYGHNLIDLSIGDSDIHTDDEIIDKTFADIKSGQTHYANPYGIRELRTKLCDAFYEDHYVKYTIDECMITTSGNHALWLTLTAIINPDDEVIVLEPYYPFYPNQIAAAGGIPICVAMDGLSGFHLNIPAIINSITASTKAIIVNSPNNPTGVHYTPDEINLLTQIAIKHDIIIIMDDVYTNFCYTQQYTPLSINEKIRNHTILVGSFSKNYVMTGWRVGFILTSPDLIHIMKEINENNTFTSPTISQVAAIHALDCRKRILNQLHHEFKNRVYYLYNELNKIPKLKVLKPEGGIYLFVDVSQTGMDGFEFADKLFSLANVAVISGHSYGDSTKNYIRITASRHLEALQKAVAQIKKFIAEHSTIDI